MKYTLIPLALLTLLLSACQGNGPMQDTGTIRPVRPAGEVITVEPGAGDTLCVTEDDIRTCVPRVGEGAREETN